MAGITVIALNCDTPRLTLRLPVMSVKWAPLSVVWKTWMWSMTYAVRQSDGSSAMACGSPPVYAAAGSSVAPVSVRTSNWPDESPAYSTFGLATVPRNPPYASADTPVVAIPPVLRSAENV